MTDISHALVLFTKLADVHIGSILQGFLCLVHFLFMSIPHSLNGWKITNNIKKMVRQNYQDQEAETLDHHL